MPHGSKRLSAQSDQYIAKPALQRVLLSNQLLPNQLFFSQGGMGKPVEFDGLLLLSAIWLNRFTILNQFTMPDDTTN
jgi:hypothetical protein